MTFILDRLVELDLARRLPDTEDRRVIQISLTEKGKRVLKKGRQHIIQNVESKLRKLSPEELELFAQTLNNLKEINICK